MCTLPSDPGTIRFSSLIAENRRIPSPESGPGTVIFNSPMYFFSCLYPEHPSDSTASSWTFVFLGLLPCFHGAHCPLAPGRICKILRLWDRACLNVILD